MVHTSLEDFLRDAKPHICVRPTMPNDAPIISELVQASFREFVAPDWKPEAHSHFMVHSSPARFARLIENAAFTAVALAGKEVVGFILLSSPAKLDFLFIHKMSVRQGIGSLLWEGARNHIEVNFPDVRTVDLNSSPYAVPAYKSLGFYPISEPFRRAGCLATRMACWLPGRALSKVA